MDKKKKSFFFFHKIWGASERDRSCEHKYPGTESICKTPTEQIDSVVLVFMLSGWPRARPCALIHPLSNTTYSYGRLSRRGTSVEKKKKLFFFLSISKFGLTVPPPTPPYPPYPPHSYGGGLKPYGGGLKSVWGGSEIRMGGV